MKGLALNPAMIILFVIGAIIGLTAISTMLSGTSVSGYYNANQDLAGWNGSVYVDTNVSTLFTLVATFVPIGIILAVLIYFFKMS